MLGVKILNTRVQLPAGPVIYEEAISLKKEIASFFVKLHLARFTPKHTNSTLSFKYPFVESILSSDAVYGH